MQALFKNWFQAGDMVADTEFMAKKPPPKRPAEISPAWGERLRKFREEKLGETQAVFGDRFDVAQVTVSRWEQGYPPQRKFWRRLAALTGESPHLMFAAEHSDLSRERNEATLIGGTPIIATARLPVEGRIGAGQWVEIQQYDIDMGVIEAPMDTRFRGVHQMAFLVDGDSMDLAGIPAGFYVTCVDFADSGLSLQTGMTVVVQQTRDGGHLVRRLVKEVHVFRDRYELRSRSSNPAHRTLTVPIAFFDEPSDEIKVIAVVLGVFKKVPLGRD